MPTTYLSSSGINQKFTSGLIGAPVDRSFSNTSGILFGPIISHQQNFKSGSEDDETTVNEINTCGQYYYRITEDPVLCPPGGCAIPILTSAALSSSCNATYNFKYNVTYNSASIGALRTKIQYSTDSTFSSNVTSSDWISNTGTTPMLPINVSNLSNPPLSNYTPVYFRAFNECSPILTSSYSNVITAVCQTAPPTPIYEFFNINIYNNTNEVIYLKQSNTSKITQLQPFPAITSFPIDFSKVTFQISIASNATTKPPTRINDGKTNYAQYSITASATSNYSSLITTTITPQIDALNDDIFYTNYKITTVQPSLQTTSTPSSTTIC